MLVMMILSSLGFLRFRVSMTFILWFMHANAIPRGSAWLRMPEMSMLRLDGSGVFVVSGFDPYLFRMIMMRKMRQVASIPVRSALVSDEVFMLPCWFQARCGCVFLMCW